MADQSGDVGIYLSASGASGVSCESLQSLVRAGVVALLSTDLSRPTNGLCDDPMVDRAAIAGVTLALAVTIPMSVLQSFGKNAAPAELWWLLAVPPGVC